MSHGSRDSISIEEGKINEARINYNSSSHNLSILFTGLINNATVWQSLSYNIDLRDHLPEWVALGFSAVTRSSTVMHTIRTWDFSSTLEDIVTKPSVRTVFSPVTCRSLIHRVLRNLQGRTNNASEGGSPDVPSPMPKSVGNFGEY
jgi:hypothetical protein